MVLLHGLGSSSEDWQQQIDAFSHDYQLIIPDLPLHGKSEGDPTQFSLKGCADVVAALLDELAISSTHIVGISMGGMVGLELAIHHPKKVSGLVMINSIAESRPRMLNEHIMVWLRRLLLKYADISTVARLMGKKLLPGEALLEVREKAQQRWQQTPAAHYQIMFEKVVSWQVLDQLHHVKCPVHLIASENDYTSYGAKKVLAAVLRGGTSVCLPGAGHLVTMEKPALFNNALSEYLSDLYAGIQN
ncbi:alpha/beta fold hydrolase [Veronia pacifica]|uniref:alpha/beta fold hydrolase n=1 Tax=Veronia pacifica TaxID=1080227 RepID=UPI001FE1C4FC|nr:alpha/beta hydrolase [Veronia pacifica]